MMPSEPNRLFFDRYSLAHAALGMVAHASRIPPAPAIAGAVAFELIENPLKRVTANLWPDSRPDGWQNSTGDVAAFTAGYAASAGLIQTPAGRALLTALVAVAAGVWMWSITDAKRAPPAS